MPCLNTAGLASVDLTANDWESMPVPADSPGTSWCEYPKWTVDLLGAIPTTLFVRITVAAGVGSWYALRLLDGAGATVGGWNTGYDEGTATPGVHDHELSLDPSAETLVIEDIDANGLLTATWIGSIAAPDAGAESTGITFAQVPGGSTISEEIPAEGHGEIMLFGFGLASTLQELGGVGLGRIALQQSTSSASIETPTFGVGSGTIQLLAGYSFGLGVAEPATGDGTIALLGTGRAASTFGDGVLRVLGYGESYTDDDSSTPPIYYDDAVYIEEGLAFGQALKSHITLLVEEAFHFAVRRNAEATVKTKTIEKFTFGDQLAVVYMELVEAGVVFSSTVSADYQMVSRVVDRLLAKGVAHSYAEAINSIVDAMSFGILAELFAHEQITETMLASGTVAELYTAVEALVDSLLISGSSSASFNMTVAVTDELLISGELSTSAELYQLVREGLGFAISYSTDSGEHVAWTLNTASKGLTRYTNYPYNSFAKIGGKYLGMSSVGLFELVGDSDDGEPISAKIRLGLWDLGTRLFKRFNECYIGWAGNGDMILRTISPHPVTGEKQAAVYRVHPRQAVTTRESKFSVGKGIKSVDWDFELENLNGSDFDLAALEFHPLRTSRRTRG
jgi:hypothetical protein